MIYLVYGPDTYRSRALVRNIVEEFKKKTGSTQPSIFRFDAEENEPVLLFNEARSLSFFGAKRLFVIERLFSAKKNAASELAPFLKQWVESKDETFVFWDVELSDSPALRLVRKHGAKTQEFPLLEGARLSAWLERELQRRDITLPKEVSRGLSASSCGDLWKLTRELDKYEVGGEAEVYKKRAETKIWDFTDSFFSDKRRALVASFKLFRSGEDELYLLGALSRTLRSLLVLRDILDKNGNLAEAGNKLGLKPYPLYKQAEIARREPLGTLASLQRLLFRADTDIKTGKLPAPIAFLNLFVKN